MKSSIVGYTFAVLFLLFTIACKKEKPEELISSSGSDLNLREAASYDLLLFENITNRTLPFRSPCRSGSIGGGSGYINIVTSGNKTITYLDVAGNPKTPAQLGIELSNTIATASAGDVIFIEPACIINVGNTIIINSSITIASNRGAGISHGALIKNTGITGFGSLFKIQSDNVRITGLQLEGDTDEYIGDDCIDALGVKYITVDNCDIYYWGRGIYVHETSNTTIPLTSNAFTIRNNYIHQNLYRNAAGGLEYGYGIVLDNAFVDAYANIFHNNRHDIAGTGKPKSGYEVSCSIFLESITPVANVDMHSDNENKASYAGGFIHIHHNDFRDINPQANIFPVGKLKTLCLVDNNVFAGGTVSIYSDANGSVFLQQPYLHANTADCYGNFVAVNNIYAGRYLGWYVKNNWNKNSFNNFFRIPSTNDLLMSNNEPIMLGGGGFINKSLQELDYYFGDFNGDGSTDIFKSENNSWYYLPLNTGYTDSWIQIANSGYKPGLMGLTGPATNSNYLLTRNSNYIDFGDFDTDNKTDIISTTGTVWNVSYGNSPGWTTYVNSSSTLDQLLLGKFNHTLYNNNITDVFSANGSIWQISYDGSNWITANNSTYPLSSLKTGDFNADGKCDIFCTTGSSWQYSSNATSAWVPLATSTLAPTDMVIGDFNSDGKSDVIGLNSGWQVSLGGIGSWQSLNTTIFPLSSFQYGNF